MIAEKTEVETAAWYLGGPMTGLPQFNFPAFDAAAADLRGQGYEVVSPAELDDDSTRQAALASPDGAPNSGSSNGETWGDFLARDLKIVADQVDGVVLLDGWERSKGARTESFMAFVCGKPILQYPSMEPVPKIDLIRAWVGPWWDAVETIS